jgi:hypothetical protein
MAVSAQNIITEGLRGKIGNLIFRKWGEKTVVSSVPNYRNIKWSVAQVQNRDRFREAMAYARKVLVDPGMRKYYQKKAKGMQTLWNVAVADYMKRPKIEATDIRGYKGKKGDLIRIKASDNYQVAGVSVSIADIRGAIIETGMAAKEQTANRWIYKSTRENPDWKGSIVRIRVSDLPGNHVTAHCPV